MTSTTDPATWHPVHRDDGELLGFVAGAGDAWTPLAVFGPVLGPTTDREAAEQHLSGIGIGYLAETWELEQDGTWISVQVLEASPAQVTVMCVDFGHPDRYGQRHTLDVPTGARLRLRGRRHLAG